MKIDDFGDRAPNFDAAREMCCLLAYVYNKDQAGFDKALGLGGTDKLWVQESGTWEPGFCVVEVADGSWLVVIEGTTSVTQFVAHLWGTMAMQWPYGTALVNLFFYQAAKTIDEKLVNLLPQSGRATVRFSGHSLGGGVATILGYMYRQRLGKDPPASVQVLTFGEPFSFTTKDVSFFPLDCHWRFTSEGDAVPLLPPAGKYTSYINWANPLIASQAQTTWVADGTEIVLYARGGQVSEPAPDPIPDGWSNNFPATHYIPNYWARLVLNQQNFGGNLPSDFDLKSMEKTLANFPNVQITPELPSVFIGPDGRLVSVPGNTQPQGDFSVAVPGLIKHTWTFQDQNGASWNEEFYGLFSRLTDGTRKSLVASLPSGNQAIVLNRLNLLWPRHRLQKITAQYPSGNRLAADITYNLAGGGGGPLSSPDVNSAGLTAEACVVQFYGVNGAQRKLWMRGFAEDALSRDPVNGFDTISANVAKYLPLFIQNCADFGYGVLPREKKPSIQVSLPNSIESVSSPVAGGLVNVTMAVPHGFANFSQVIIAQCSPKDLPDLNGVWTVQVPGGSTTVFQIPYYPPGGIGAVLERGYARQYVQKPLDPFDPTTSGFDYVGVRKTKTPLRNGRGAKRALVRRKTT